MTDTPKPEPASAKRIRRIAHEMGVIVSPAPPSLSNAAARTHVRRQLLPGQLHTLCKASGKSDKTVLRALGCDPTRAGRKPGTSLGKPTLRIPTADAVRWLMSISKLRELSGEASHALEIAAIGMANGDAHANKNPYDGKPFK